MRRGLIEWSKTELPEAVFAMRVAQAQAALAADNLDALVIYTNITRSAGASWLTGFVPYWSEGVAVLPRNGPPVLVVALTPRVKGWIERTSCASSVTCAPRFGRETAKIVAVANPAARIGVLELDTFPNGTAADLAAEGGTLVDATALFERLRAAADPAEIALTTRAASIARDALAQIDAHARSVADEVATVDGTARLAGAEDVFVAVAPDLATSDTFLREVSADATFGDTFAVRITLAYKGHWMRAVRSFSRTGAGTRAIRAANERFADAVARLPDTSALAGAASWLIEGTVRSQPLETLAGSFGGRSGITLDGKVASVAATYTIDGMRIAAGGAAIVGSTWCASAALVASH